MIRYLTFDGSRLVFDGNNIVLSTADTIVTPDRIYSEYRNSPKAVAWYGITSALAEPLLDVLGGVRSSYDIDTATSYELGVLENIVDVTVRVNPSAIPPGLDLVKIRRMLIKSKIAKNNGDATDDNILSAIQFITGVENAIIDDHENMSFSIYFLTELSAEATYILSNFDIVPRAQGVRFQGFSDVRGFVQFGDSEHQFGGDDTQFNFLFGGS